MAPRAMFIPAIGMIVGLLIAVFISYRKPRDYDREKTVNCAAVEKVEIKSWKIVTGVIAIIVGLFGQLWLDSLVIAALAGIVVFIIVFAC